MAAQDSRGLQPGVFPCNYWTRLEQGNAGKMAGAWPSPHAIYFQRTIPALARCLLAINSTQAAVTTPAPRYTPLEASASTWHLRYGDPSVAMLEKRSNTGDAHETHARDTDGPPEQPRPRMKPCHFPLRIVHPGQAIVVHGPTA